MINNYIQANTKVSLDRFETIIKTLFIRVQCNRTNKNQLSEKIIHKKVLSDVLLNIIKARFGVNGKIKTQELYERLKLKSSENSIFKILETQNDDDKNTDNNENYFEDNESNLINED